MPTISEPLWPEQDEKTSRIVNDFLGGVDSEAVFKARLYGNGLRGQDLDMIMRETLHVFAQKNLLLHRGYYNPTKVLVMERDGTRNTLRFKDTASAGKAVELLRRQPNVLFACRVML